MDASEMRRRETPDRGDGHDAPVGRVGGRSPSTLFTGGRAPAAGPLAPGQRWSVARKRAVVLRLMRENALLSPHRARPRPDDDHDRKISTEAPNLMWALGGTQVATVRDGKVWLFAVAEHWNAEALGWHVSKRGTRHEALQAMCMAVRQQVGHLGRDAARGIQLRHDHGRVIQPSVQGAGSSSLKSPVGLLSHGGTTGRLLP
jgi:transposase InsO family protein